MTPFASIGRIARRIRKPATVPLAFQPSLEDVRDLRLKEAREVVRLAAAAPVEELRT